MSRSDSEAGALAHARRIGEDIEFRVSTAVDALRLVDDEIAEWHDAVADRAVIPAETAVPTISTTPVVPRGQQIEIKAARRRLGSGARGRWLFREDQHARLARNAAHYALAVWDWQSAAGGRERVVTALAFVPARVVSRAVDGHWHDSSRPDERHRKLTWSRVVDPELVGGESS